MGEPSTPSAASSSGILTPPPPGSPDQWIGHNRSRRSSTLSADPSNLPLSGSARHTDSSLRSPTPRSKGESSGFLPTGYIYPLAVEDVTVLTPEVQDFKLARFLPCRTEDCDCTGLRPPEGAQIRLQVKKNKGKEKEVDFKPILWDICGQCGHGWRLDDEPDGGHTLSEDIGEDEQQRRRRVAGRIEELYNVRHSEYDLTILVRG